MSQYEQWQREHGVGPWAREPLSDVDWGYSSFTTASNVGAGESQYDTYLRQHRHGVSQIDLDLPPTRGGIDDIGFGARTSDTSQYDNYRQGQAWRDWLQHEPTLNLGTDEIFASAPVYVPTHRRSERRERPNLTAILAGIGAFALAGSLAITALTGSRGHVEAHPGAQPPVAAGKANPNKTGPKWLQIFNAKTGTINMANAAKDAAQIPTAVRGTEGSVEEILNYQNHNPNGITYGMAGTGYVENINGRNWLISAAHCVAGTPDSLPYPNYIVETNVNGSEHKNFVLGFQVPKSYDRFTDTFIDSPSDDLTIIGVMPTEWFDGGGGHHNGDNGWNELPALQNATSKPSVGSLLFTYGYRPANGQELEPPQAPVLQAMVVVGYSDNGNRMILLPVDTQRASTQQEGNSGSAIVNKLGKVVSTLIAGTSETQQWFQKVYHVKVVGGDGAQIDPGQIRFEVATVNSPSNFANAEQAKPIFTNLPSYIPG